MTPNERRALQGRVLAYHAAVKRLETNSALYQNVMVKIARRTDEAIQNLSDAAKTPYSQNRMQHAVELLDITAEEYLRLVHDLQSQRDFETVLDHYFRVAWEQFTATAYTIVPALPSHCGPIRERVRYWAMRGWEKLDDQPQRSEHTETVSSEVTKTVAELRKERIDPILRDKGMSPSRWASKAGVDPSVVYDYLSGKSNPRPDSRKALAEVLELEPSDLPD